MTFPVSPNRGDTHTFDDTVWIYNGRAWDRKTVGSNNSTSYANNELHDRVTTLEGFPFLAGYATEAYVGTQVANLIDAAPGALDTLNEIAAAIGDDANYATSITTAIAAVQADVDQNETDANTAIAAVQADVNANETTAAALVTTLETARNVITSAISARVTTLEVDPTTATALATVQADVDTNEAASDTAIANLSTNLNNEGAARLLADNAIQADVDANEVTAANAVTAAAGVAAAATAAQNVAMLAAVAVVQADVDTNESDADTAIALKYDKAGGTVTGNVVVAKNFPDLELKSGDEKRILFTDAGGGGTGAIKHVGSSIDFYAGGIASGNKEFVVASTGVTVSAAVTLSGGLTDAANDSAAASAGVAVGQLYRNGSVVMIRVS